MDFYIFLSYESSSRKQIINAASICGDDELMMVNSMTSQPCQLETLRWCTKDASAATWQTTGPRYDEAGNQVMSERIVKS